MKTKVLLFLLVTGLRPMAQNFDSLCTQVNLTLSNIEKYHFSAPKYTENTRAEVVELFINGADDKNLFLLKQDEVYLQSIAVKDEDGVGFCLLLRKANELINVRKKQCDSLLTELEKKPFDLASKDTIVFYDWNKPRFYSSDLKHHSKRLIKRIQYNILNELVSPHNEQADVLKLKPAELAKKTEELKKKNIRQLKQQLNNNEPPRQQATELANTLCNALLKRADPHSSFFDEKELTRFNSSLSTTNEAYGFSVNEDKNGNVVIEDLAPGGPAWKSNNLNTGDVIVAYRFEGEKETEVENWELAAFNESFERTMAKTVELKVRKKDLKIISVSLTKEVIASQENLMNSYVIDFNGVKTGYIPIPSFYLDGEEETSLGCANDVAKEIIKLKQDSVAGILIDLRYNGGGSMREAMSLAGIFIDEGPVAVYKQRHSKPTLLKDLNRGSIWDGPLLLLINSASASASEFVTATLRDYNRAVVAGSRTFGKGTSQQVFFTDSSAVIAGPVPGSHTSPFGYQKMTLGKFYRLSLKSHQGIGIEPDVPIPGIIEFIYPRENEYPYSLPADSVIKKVSYVKHPDLPIAKLVALSAARINAGTNFRKILQLSDSLAKTKGSDVKVPLTLAGFKKYSESSNNLDVKIELLFTEENNNFRIRNNTLNERLNTFNEYTRKNTSNSINALKKDLILHEAIYILNDLVTLSSK